MRRKSRPARSGGGMRQDYGALILKSNSGRLSTKGKLRRAPLAAALESVHAFFVLSRDEAAGRFGHRRVAAGGDLNIGAAHEPSPLIVIAKRAIS